MAEATGFDALKKTFAFTLPVSGKKGKLRYATRMDKIIAVEQAGPEKKVDTDVRFELTYLGRIIVEIEGVQGPFSYDQLRNYPEKDLLFLRAYDAKLNDLSEDDFRKVLDSFATALKS